MNSDGATLRQEESTQLALNRLLLANLTTLAAGLAWLYVIYAIIHGTLLVGSMRIYMTLLAAVSAGILATLQHWLSRKTPPASAANAIGAGIATIILANSTTHFWATGEDFQTSNFILLLVGQGLLFVSRGWLAVTVGMTWLAWGGVMLRLSGPPHFAHWLIAMTVATALAGIAYTVRLRTLRRLVGLRHDLERRVEERTQAVSQANATLAAEVVSRREAEVEVREVAELLMLVVESLPACIAYLDQDERHSLVNEKYAECFRRIKADFKGTGLREMVGEAFYVAVEPSVRQVFLGERPRVEIRWSGNDGTPRIYDLRLTPHLGEDRRVNGFFLLAIDVTEQKRQEEAFIAAQRSESLGVMAGGIAHDFNNLLTGILGNAGLIKLDLPPGCNAYVGLEHVEIAAQRAAELCSQMLAYSGRGRFVVQALNVNEIISEMTHLMRFSISKFAILKQELASEPPWVMADATQMRQVIMNLVINASEAIGETPGVIDIATRLLRAKRSELKELHLSPDLPEGEYVNLEVRDTGCGMTPKVLARIFDPFYTTKFTGRGLGLAAVLGIIRGHQGGIRMESHPGRGSTFHIYLPAVAADPLEAIGSSAESPEWRASSTVLLVDDEEVVRQFTGRILKSFGLTVIEATDGREAVALFHRHAPQISCVLLDLTMPQLNGEQTFAELRKTHPSVPVVLMSGYSEQEVANRFSGKTLSGFLQKPFTAKSVHEQLSRIFHP